MAAPMDVVFSFDTTGSMSQVLDEVKCRVNDLIQRLQADIPRFKVGIIAHGDYCDRDLFYDIRTLDLTDNLADVVNFVSETTGTGGGDVPECYELSLRHACDMSWRKGSRRVFVVIGDAYPHGPDYPENTLNIDWQEELSSLVRKSITVYGVQYGQDPESLTFFQRLSAQSGGQHLRLQDMGDISHAIMAICYREHGPDLLQNYEAEVRAENAAASLKAGLESMFTKLGGSQEVTPADEAQEGTAASDLQEITPANEGHEVTPVVDADHATKTSLALLSSVSSFRSVRSADTDILNKDNVENEEDESNTRRPMVRIYSSTVSSQPRTPINTDNEWLSDSDDESYVPEAGLSSGDESDSAESCESQTSQTSKDVGTTKGLKRKREDTDSSAVKCCSVAKKARLEKHMTDSFKKQNCDRATGKLHKTLAEVDVGRKNTKKSLKFTSKGKKSQNLPRAKRHAAGDKQFRFNNLPWSKWHLAAAKEVPQDSGIWKTVGQRDCRHTLWRTDLLRLCEAKMMNALSVSDLGEELRSRIVPVNKHSDTKVDGALFEVGVIPPDSRNIQTVWLHATNQRKKRTAVPKLLSQPWYSGLTRPVKEPLTAAVKAGSRVYIRWALVQQVQKIKREILGQYDYLWCL
ncbi:alpha-protein kinase vwkA [Elysia marginata]|uniref:Alpha-protein kinase vwkA n=1 Tax=Elysia marginata TaxID=1093978 RepID=A0AAV4EMF0_9GAST|nr:alpha-protein kinase vwkA [Elysia marginata]